MEITTSPHRPASTPWGRLVALVIILAPVSVLVLLPIGLGLDRYVMSGSSMDSGAPGAIPQGSVVFERPVPLGDLQVGDVITFHPPAASRVDGLVTHRIVSISAEGIRTQGDAQPVRDPWVLRPRGATLSRVVYTLPWVGYGYLVIFHPVTRVVMAVAAALLALLVTSEIRRRRAVATLAPGHAEGGPGADPEGSDGPVGTVAARANEGGER